MIWIDYNYKLYKIKNDLVEEILHKKRDLRTQKISQGYAKSRVYLLRQHNG